MTTALAWRPDVGTIDWAELLRTGGRQKGFRNREAPLIRVCSADPLTIVSAVVQDVRLDEMKSDG